MEFSLLNLLLVLLFAAIGGAIAMRLGYPALMGEMVAGIICGPMVLGWIHDSDGLKLLAEVGVFLMMLYIGLEVDHRDLLKASWSGFLAAVGAFFIPFVSGYLLMTVYYEYTGTAALFIGLAMGVTSLATKSRTLVELKLLGTRVANVLLAAALVCDTLALVFFAGISGFAESDSANIKSVILILLKAAMFFGVTVIIGMRVFPLIGKMFRKFGFTERTTNFTMVIFVGLVFAELAELAGLHSIIGAFIAGLFIREEVLQRKLSHDVSGLVRDVSLGFLAPVFFVSAGFNVDVSVLWTNTSMLGILLVVAVAAKIIGTLLFYLPTRNGWREGLAIGAGMNGQGAMAIIVSELGLEMGLVSGEQFSILILMVFFTTACEPVFIKLSAAWLKRSGHLVRADDNRDLIIIAGAAPLARLLGRELSKSEKVCLIDNNSNLCQAASAEGLTAIKGNVLSEEQLDVAGAVNAKVFLAMTSNHEVNRLSAEYARNMFGIPLTWTWPLMGIPSFPMAPENETRIDASSMPVQTPKWNEWITRKEVELATIQVTNNQLRTNFTSLMIEHNALPLVVERKGRRYPAMVMEELRAGDVIHALRHLPPQHQTQTDVFEELVRVCPILDIKGSIDYNELFARSAEALAPSVGIDPEIITSFLKKREDESSTVVVSGVAIPHVIIDSDQPVALLIARTRDGTIFPHPDISPVQFTFVIIGARSARNLHLRILSAIAQLFQDPAFEDIMLAAPDADAIRQIILTTRRRRF